MNMNKFVFNSKMSIIQKITLAGLFIALTTILQKVVAINYLPILPFVRISFGGTALIIYSSIVLGPFWGLLVGASSDLLGYLIFDPKTMGFFPQITAIYAVLGFVSYFVYKLIKTIKNEKVLLIVEYSFFAAMFVFLTVFISCSSSLTLYGTTYQLEVWQKITIPLVLAALSVCLFVCNFFISKYFKKKSVQNVNVHTISFSCLIIEIGVMMAFGTLMKGWAFGFSTYPVILISQIIVGFVNIPLNTFLISYIMLFTRKYIE